ncbi:MAG: bifunctional hydroxymethylpyrimidine kinase/phosphomethylpyrimidine kinase [Alphaproteobacteria bacterium]
MSGRILLVGEHIANGGLGIHGDIATVTALGGNPLSALTIMSTTNAPIKRKAQSVPRDFITDQIAACYNSPGVDSIKIGAINSTETIDAIADAIETSSERVPVVISPIMVSEMGEAFLNSEAINHFKQRLIPHASLFLLNIRDAELFSGTEITDVDSMRRAAQTLHQLGCEAVLITGGLLQGEELFDILVTGEGENILSMKKHHIHRAESYRFGGGWVLATAIATSLGQGFSLMDSINRGRQFVDKAIGTSFNADQDYQSLNISHTIQPFAHSEQEQPFKVIPGTKFRSFS